MGTPLDTKWIGTSEIGPKPEVLWAREKRRD
jgi:hypothetical protein